MGVVLQKLQGRNKELESCPYHGACEQKLRLHGSLYISPAISWLQTHNKTQ